jgi:hypothetical protein
MHQPNALTLDLVRPAFADLVQRVGLVTACKQVGIAREAGSRVVAGLAVRRGTVVLVAHALGLLQPTSNADGVTRSISHIAGGLRA